MAITIPKAPVGHRGNSTRSILIGLSISLAGFINGIDTGIIASTIAQETFKSYMYGPAMENASLRAGIVSGYYAGYAVGSAMAAFLMDKISRRWTLLLGALVSIVGAVIQTAANGSIMMIFGRALSGLSSGLVYPTAPVYLAELSAPENRGFLVGLKGLMNTLGFFTAGFVGYAGSFAVGNLQWRIPLATQAPPAVLLAVLTIFLPYSPRWLAQKERYDEAKKVMYYLHSERGAEFVESEYSEMYAQIRFEAGGKKMANFWALFSKRYIRRTLLACLTVQMMKLSGSNVINNYQSIMYESLGYKGQTVLLITALYGCMAVIGQILNVFFVADHWRRRTTLMSGCAVLVVILSVLTALSKLYPDDHNPSGSRAGVAFVFLFAFAYSFYFNSINWVLVSEIFPLELRAVGVGFSVFMQSTTAIWISYAASIALDVISWKFYFVFIACNMFAGTIYYFFLPETRFLTLEEVAVKFGDPAAESMVKQMQQKEDGILADDDKTGSESIHVEGQQKV